MIRVILLEKELEILKRKKKKRIIPEQIDRIIFSILNILYNIKDSIHIFRPETILKWQRELTKGHWTFKSNKRKPGRPPINNDIKQLILRIKNNSLYIGVTKITGELLKLGIKIDPKTVWNIINDFRRKGKIRKSLTWQKFLTMQIGSLYGMDFFTVDTMFGQRFYVYFIIHHKTREIIQFAITQNPVKEFVRQQLILFTEDIENSVYMIHDRTGEFIQNYIDFGIKSVKTSVKAPVWEDIGWEMSIANHMNSICERWIGSCRREALDSFLIFSEGYKKNPISNWIFHLYLSPIENFISH